MKTRLFLIAALLAALACARPASAERISADTWPGLNPFQVIEQNDIFNPHRQPPEPGPTNVPVEREYSFTLKGTMTYENQGYAFFDGGAVNRSGVLGLADTINGYKIAEITNNTVKLAASSNQFVTLKVGMQMRKVENGPWNSPTQAP